MKEVDKGCLMNRMGVSGRMFLLVPAHPGSAEQRAVKRLCVRVFCIGKQDNRTAPGRSNEYRIKKKILRHYDRTSRPVRDDRTSVNVLIALSLSHILDTVCITKFTCDARTQAIAAWSTGWAKKCGHALACNFAKYSLILIFFTRKLSNKPVLISLLTAPPHIQYVATLPCTLSLMVVLLTLIFHEVV